MAKQIRRERRRRRKRRREDKGQVRGDHSDNMEENTGKKERKWKQRRLWRT